MKKIFLILTTMALSFSVFAGEWKEPKAEKPFNPNAIRLNIEGGAAYSMMTRIEDMKKYNRSNFVYETHFVGVYVGARTVNIPHINFYGRMAIYYPFYLAFNGMKQFAKQTILYGFDFHLGPYWNFDQLKYVRFRLSPGIHYMYQLSDEYHLNVLGVGLMTVIELPLTQRWTILLNPGFSFDYPNLGTNRRVQPYDWCWSYKFELGFRYSRKSPNKYYYIHTKTSTYRDELYANPEKAEQRWEEAQKNKAAAKESKAEAKKIKIKEAKELVKNNKTKADDNSSEIEVKSDAEPELKPEEIKPSDGE